MTDDIDVNDDIPPTREVCIIEGTDWTILADSVYYDDYEYQSPYMRVYVEALEVKGGTLIRQVHVHAATGRLDRVDPVIFTRQKVLAND